MKKPTAAQTRRLRIAGPDLFKALELILHEVNCAKMAPSYARVALKHIEKHAAEGIRAAMQPKGNG